MNAAEVAIVELKQAVAHAEETVDKLQADRLLMAEVYAENMQAITAERDKWKAAELDARHSVKCVIAESKRFKAILEDFPNYPTECIHDQEPDYCDGCRYLFENSVGMWNHSRDALLKEAGR